MKKILFLAFIILASSCVKLKDRIYFQDGNFSDSTKTHLVNQLTNYQIQPKDILNIDVYAFDQEEVEIYRKDLQSNPIGGGVGASGLYLRGYVVDDKGSIYLSGGIGEVPVSGLTLEEVRDRIREKISKTLNEFTVEVKLLNFNVSVLGEVARPGLYQVYQDQFNILQGLAMAGDLTDFANRRNIKLLRQRPDGVEVIEVDLTKIALLKSPYFFLQPNDAIYVEPLKADTKRTNLPVLGTIFGGVSAVVLIANLIVNISK